MKKNKKMDNNKKNKKKRTPAPPGNVRPNSFVPRAPKGTHAGEGSLASEKVLLPILCAKAAFGRLTPAGISYNRWRLLLSGMASFMLVPISLLHVTVLPSLAIGWEATPLDFFSCVGSSSARAVDFSIFSVVLCTPQEFLKRFGEYPHEIAGPRDSEMRGQNTTACTFCAAQR